MGKKKGNDGKRNKVANSARAASRVGANTFIGFGAASAASGAKSTSSTALTASSSSVSSTDSTYSKTAAPSTLHTDDALPDALRLPMKKSAKRDPVTRNKGLDEIRACIQSYQATVDLSDSATASDAAATTELGGAERKAIAGAYATLYERVGCDPDSIVRSKAQLVLGDVAKLVQRELAPHLRRIMGVWLRAIHDERADVSHYASMALESTFPNTEKRIGALVFTLEAVVAHVDKVLRLDAKKLRAATGVSKEEAPALIDAYHASSVDTLSFLLRALSDDEESCARIRPLLDTHVWRLLASLENRTRRSAYRLLVTACTKTSALVLESDEFAVLSKNALGAIGEKDVPSVTNAWEALLAFVGVASPQCWQHIDVRKVFLPRLHASLRTAGHGVPQTVYTCLYPLLCSLSVSNGSEGGESGSVSNVSRVCAEATVAANVLRELWKGTKAEAFRTRQHSDAFLSAFSECFRYFLRLFSSDDVIIDEEERRKREEEIFEEVATITKNALCSMSNVSLDDVVKSVKSLSKSSSRLALYIIASLENLLIKALVIEESDAEAKRVKRVNASRCVALLVELSGVGEKEKEEGACALHRVFGKAKSATSSVGVAVQAAVLESGGLSLDTDSDSVASVADWVRSHLDDTSIDIVEYAPLLRAACVALDDESARLLWEEAIERVRGDEKLLLETLRNVLIGAETRADSTASKWQLDTFDTLVNNDGIRDEDLLEFLIRGTSNGISNSLLSQETIEKLCRSVSNVSVNVLVALLETTVQSSHDVLKRTNLFEELLSERVSDEVWHKCVQIVADACLTRGRVGEIADVIMHMLQMSEREEAGESEKEREREEGGVEATALSRCAALLSRVYAHVDTFDSVEARALLQRAWHALNVREAHLTRNDDVITLMHWPFVHVKEAEASAVDRRAVQLLSYLLLHDIPIDALDTSMVIDAMLAYVRVGGVDGARQSCLSLLDALATRSTTPVTCTDSTDAELAPLTTNSAYAKCLTTAVRDGVALGGMFVLSAFLCVQHAVDNSHLEGNSQLCTVLKEALLDGDELGTPVLCACMPLLGAYVRDVDAQCLARVGEALNTEARRTANVTRSTCWRLYASVCIYESVVGDSEREREKVGVDAQRVSSGLRRVLSPGPHQQEDSLVQLLHNCLLLRLLICLIDKKDSDLRKFVDISTTHFLSILLKLSRDASDTFDTLMERSAVVDVCVGNVLLIRERVGDEESESESERESESESKKDGSESKSESESESERVSERERVYTAVIHALLFHCGLRSKRFEAVNYDALRSHLVTRLAVCAQQCVNVPPELPFDSEASADTSDTFDTLGNSIDLCVCGLLAIVRVRSALSTLCDLLRAPLQSFALEAAQSLGNETEESESLGALVKAAERDENKQTETHTPLLPKPFSDALLAPLPTPLDDVIATKTDTLTLDSDNLCIRYARVGLWTLVLDVYEALVVVEKETRAALFAYLRVAEVGFAHLSFLYALSRDEKSIESDFALPSDEEALDLPTLRRWAASVLLRTVLTMPALARLWYLDDVQRRDMQRISEFFVRNVSPNVLAMEFDAVCAYVENEMDDDDVYRLRVSPAAREVTAFYEEDEVVLSIVIRLPPAYPLMPMEVSGHERLGVTESRWRRWLLSMTKAMMSLEGSLLDALQLWQRNLDKYFDGLEPCPICYSVIHVTNNTIPKLTCLTCKNRFHSSCLYKWFTSSHKSNCPLCQSNFGSF